jgi:subtilisin family serine protease
MDALGLLKMPSLMAESSGSPEIAVGIIDGPVDLKHEAFAKSNITPARDNDFAACRRADNIACMHGTFVTGILTGGHGRYPPPICPDCQIILRPIFSEESHEHVLELPSCTPHELAQAIVDCIEVGANIINLSVGLSTTSLTKFREVEEAYTYAMRKGVPIIAAAGNQGQIGYFSIHGNPWIIPVVSCDAEGRPDPSSNMGRSIAKHGLMAPGTSITSVSAGGGFTQLSGTSFATPFVTGTIALLWSIFKQATAQEIVLSIRNVTARRYAKIFPPLCNAEESLNILQTLTNSRG